MSFLLANIYGDVFQSIKLNVFSAKTVSFCLFPIIHPNNKEIQLVCFSKIQSTMDMDSQLEWRIQLIIPRDPWGDGTPGPLVQVIEKTCKLIVNQVCNFLLH